MREILVTGRTLPETYHKALLALEHEGDIVACPDYAQNQKELSMTLVIEEPAAEPRISKLCIGGPHELMQYEMEVLDGILDFMIGADDNVWEYTYHERYAKWYDKLIAELKRNALTRRAVISIRDNQVDFSNPDPACMQNIQFFIRDDKLHAKVLFRSNDLTEAFFYNAFALIRLQERVAADVGVPAGTYTHRSNSMHCYEKDFDMLKNFVKGIKEKSFEDLTYNYQDDYKEMMEEERESIMQMVAAQKAKYGIE